ncbi:MAG: hypothetical protein JW839_03385 [Candidatus Lokiarchaeota archaeon]|nr:hypothetical protein [Candidatus Lokiarchaeota archaeon]
MSENELGRIEEVSGQVVVRVPRDTMIPSLLRIVKQEYLRGRRSGISEDPETVKAQMATECAIEDAIFTWIEEMKEEKAKKDMMDKIRRRFDQRWGTW